MDLIFSLFGLSARSQITLSELDVVRICNVCMSVKFEIWPKYYQICQSVRHQK